MAATSSEAVIGQIPVTVADRPGAEVHQREAELPLFGAAVGSSARIRQLCVRYRSHGTIDQHTAVERPLFHLPTGSTRPTRAIRAILFDRPLSADEGAGQRNALIGSSSAEAVSS